MLAIAPALMVMLTSFTRIVIVLSLTRNALGLTSIPPNQVVIGLSLFLSLFVMAPTLTTMNKVALQPLLKGDITYSQAYNRGTVPLRAFMLEQTRQSDLTLFTAASHEKPAPRDKVQMTTLVPAFVLSELKTAFIIGFVIFIPFLIIDLIVSSTLMSMGMFMLPPVLVSLPFKLLAVRDGRRVGAHRPLAHHELPPLTCSRNEAEESPVTDHEVINIAVQSILLATKLAAPILIVALGIGLAVGLLQSATQIQEQTLTFVPKLAGIALVILVAGHWMLGETIAFTHSLFNMIPQLLQS